MSHREADLRNPAADGRIGSADLDLEMALLAALASKDIGEATEPVRLDTLSSVDKEVLVQLMRGKLGPAETPATVAIGPPAVEDNSINREHEETE